MSLGFFMPPNTHSLLDAALNICVDKVCLGLQDKKTTRNTAGEECQVATAPNTSRRNSKPTPLPGEEYTYGQVTSKTTKRNMKPRPSYKKARSAKKPRQPVRLVSL